MTASLCPSKSGYSFPSKPLPIYIIGYVKEGFLSRIFSFFPSQEQEQAYPVPEPEEKFLPPASLDKNQPAIFQFSFPCQRIDHISQKAKQKTQQKRTVQYHPERIILHTQNAFSPWFFLSQNKSVLQELKILQFPQNTFLYTLYSYTITITCSRLISCRKRRYNTICRIAASCICFDQLHKSLICICI